MFISWNLCSLQITTQTTVCSAHAGNKLEGNLSINHLLSVCLCVRRQQKVCGGLLKCECKYCVQVTQLVRRRCTNRRQRGCRRAYLETLTYRRLHLGQCLYSVVTSEVLQPVTNLTYIDLTPVTPPPPTSFSRLLMCCTNSGNYPPYGHGTAC